MPGNAPVQCSDETRHYLWAVLEPNSAIKPSAKAITRRVTRRRTVHHRRGSHQEPEAAGPQPRRCYRTGQDRDTEYRNHLPDSLRKEPPMSENSTDRKTTAAAAEQFVRGKDREQPEAAANGDLASLVEGGRPPARPMPSLAPCPPP